MAKNKGGRPRFELTEKVIAQIEQLAGYGLTLSQIAAVIGVSESTLRNKKKDEAAVFAALERGRAKAQGVVGSALFNRAKAGDVAAIRWWEMTRAGRSEKQAIEHSGGLDLSAEQIKRAAREVLEGE